MPHLFSNRPKMANPMRSPLDIRHQFIWESVSAGIYISGGLIFCIGSLMFFPLFSAEETVGCMLFLAGSLLYLIVTLHDLVETLSFWKGTKGSLPAKRLEILAAWLYVLGTLLFVWGSLLFTRWVDDAHVGAWCFIVGSLAFFISASINIIQILRQTSIISLAMTNLTAVSFVAGSLLFILASIPYLWHFVSHHDYHIEMNYLAWQFLIGSFLFLVGGILNQLRSWMLMRWRLASLSHDPKVDEKILHALKGEPIKQ